MSKAEDLATGLFPLLKTDKIGNNPYITYNIEQLAKQEGFIRGYHQAEKDLELSWNDIDKIVDLYDNVYCDFSIDGKGGKINTEEHYQEVLKRFKAMKDE